MNSGGMAHPGVYAAIDIGTNTVKLTIAAHREDGSWQVLREDARTTRLGQGYAQGYLQEAAIRRTLDVLQEYIEQCREANVRQIAAVATAAVRQARNRDEFLQRAAEIGLAVTVLSGEEEARLSLLAVRNDPLWRALDAIRVLDIGGGSTEIVLSAHEGLRQASLAIGAVQLTEDILRSDPPTQSQLVDAEKWVRQAFARAQLENAPAVMIAVGGTAANMAAVKQGRRLECAEQIHGTELTYQEVEQQYRIYASQPTAARRQIPGLEPERADVILAGALIVLVAMEWFGTTSIHVSGRALRWGLLYHHFGDAG